MCQSTAPSVFRKLSQVICTAVSVVSMSLAVFPAIAQAAGADGNFRVVSGKGSFSANGETRKIPQSTFNEIVKGQVAAMVVKDQKLKINRNMSAAFFQSFAQESGVKINPNVTGPSSITLVPTGNYFAGKTVRPIITKFSGTDEGEKFSVTVKTDVNAVAKGNTLTITTRFTARDGSDTISGVITLVGMR